MGRSQFPRAHGCSGGGSDWRVPAVPAVPVRPPRRLPKVERSRMPRRFRLPRPTGDSSTSTPTSRSEGAIWRSRMPSWAADFGHSRRRVSSSFALASAFRSWVIVPDQSRHLRAWPMTASAIGSASRASSRAPDWLSSSAARSEPAGQSSTRSTAVPKRAKSASRGLVSNSTCGSSRRTRASVSSRLPRFGAGPPGTAPRIPPPIGGPPRRSAAN